MGRAGQLAVGAVIGGTALTLALVAALGLPAPRASVPPQISGADAHPGLGDTLRRCRTITVPDPECDAAWEAKRQRFFGQRKDAQ